MPDDAISSTDPLTLRGAVNQLVAERNDDKPPQPAQPAQPIPEPEPQDDTPDPADLEALDATDASEPSEPTQPEQPKIRLKDGTEATFDDVEEWRRGTLRQADYTRKTQELAEQRRQFDASFQQFSQNQDQYKQAIEQAIAIVSHFMPEQPSEELRKQDFFAWQERKAEYDSQMGKLLSLRQQHDVVVQSEQQKQQHSYQEYLSGQQQALLTAKPELRDPVKATKFIEAIREYGVKSGYKLDEINSVSDHRALIMAEKAMRYDQLMAHKAKLADKAKNASPMPPVQEPSRRQSTAERGNAALKPLQQRFDNATSANSQLRAAASLLVAERAARNR